MVRVRLTVKYKDDSTILHNVKAVIGATPDQIDALIDSGEDDRIFYYFDDFKDLKAGHHEFTVENYKLTL